MTAISNLLGDPSRRYLVCLYFLYCGSAFAQGVVASEPQSIAATLQQAGIPQNQDSLAAEAGSNSSDSPFKWGPYDLKPHFLYRFLYGDGIQASPGHPLLTAIVTFSPGFLLADANLWTLDYTPTWDLYSNHAFRDTLDQSVNAVVRKAYDEWTFQAAQAYSYTSDPLIQTGGQTSQQDYSTTLDATHQFSRKVLLDVSVGQDLQYVVGFVDTFNWTNQDWLHYRWSSRLDTAIGTGFGFVQVSRGTNSAYARPELQTSWHPTDKVSLSLTGGLEHREFYGIASPSLNTPIYSASLGYTPFTTTAITFSAGRQVTPSFFEDQSSRGTQWAVGIEQRLLTHFHLSATVSYDTTDYLASNAALAAVRSDEVLSYNVRLSTTVLRRGATAALLFQRSHDASTVPGFGYTSSQIGLELSYRY